MIQHTALVRHGGLSTPCRQGEGLCKSRYKYEHHQQEVATLYNPFIFEANFTVRSSSSTMHTFPLLFLVVEVVRALPNRVNKDSGLDYSSSIPSLCSTVIDGTSFAAPCDSTQPVLQARDARYASAQIILPDYSDCVLAAPIPTLPVRPSLQMQLALSFCRQASPIP